MAPAAFPLTNKEKVFTALSFTLVDETNASKQIDAILLTQKIDCDLV